MRSRVPSQPLEPAAIDEQHVIALAERLCRREVSSASFCAGGGNNRVYKIEAANAPFALKLYGALATNGRDRLDHEFAGLRFLGDRGITSVPRALAIDRDEGCALYEWIEGVRVSEHGPRDIDKTLEFLEALRSAGRDTGSASLMPATEAVLTLSDLIEQIEARLRRLKPVTFGEPQLGDFIDNEIVPQFQQRVSQLRGVDLDGSLPYEKRILSPSDFGFHNALRRRDGSLCFIDFEYFGWDDPVKLAADFLFHPAMDLAPGERKRFFEGVVALFDDDRSFFPRLAMCFPLYGIRWSLIILNEFVPEIWARRAYSGKGSDWEVAKRIQLAKARAKMASVRAYTEGGSIP